MRYSLLLCREPYDYQGHYSQVKQLFTLPLEQDFWLYLSTKALKAISKMK